MNTEHQFPNWENLYQEKPVETMPWFNPSLDADLERALNELKLPGKTALDIGTGPGTQAIALAERGFQVTAVDLSATAIENAKTKAKGLDINWQQDDILNTKLEQQFDLVFDRGCFHVLSPEQRQNYVLVVNKLISSQGYLFLKCFSYKEVKEAGPYRFTPQEIEEIFHTQFKICDIQETLYQGTLETFPHALFCIMQKE